MFVHLRLHSEFSVVDGTVRIDDAVAAAASDGQPAMALTDLNNMFGAVKFYKTAQKKGVQPILGAEVMLEDLLPPVKDRPLPRVLLLAQGHQGYLNLCELLSRGWIHVGNKAQASLRWEWLQELSDDLIMLSGAQAGPLGPALLAGDMEQAHAVAMQCVQTFPNRFYLELQRAGRSTDEPAALVYKATWPEERVVRCTVGTLADAGAREGIDRTALVVVGRVLGARGGLAHNGAQAESYERSKLYDPSFATGYRKASS